MTSEEDRKRVLALAQKGENGVSIAKALGLPKSTVYDILKAPAPAPPPQPATAAEPRPSAKGAPAVSAGAGASAASIMDPLDVLRRELAELERRVTLARKGSAAAHLAALKGFAAIAELVRKLEPPPPAPPPDEDPENLGLKAELRERLEQLRTDTMATASGRAQVRAYLDALDAAATATEQAA